MINSKLKIMELFESGSIKFSVPEYQRAYSWRVGYNTDLKEVDQFLEDIREQNPQKKYYLGHFLFETNTAQENHYYVIDGQQRLTTIVIFMSCLVRECKTRQIISLGEHDIDDIEDIYLKHKKNQKFETVSSDAHYFLEKIISRADDVSRESKRKSEECIEKASAFFTVQFQNASNLELEHWFSVLNNAQITTFVLEGEDAKLTATQIFSFQNDRGKDLTTLEKMKAFFMHQVYKYDAEGAVGIINILEQKFADIYTQAEEIQANEDTVLSWHCQAFTSGWESAFDNIKKDLKKSEKKVQWIMDFTASLDKTFRKMKEIEQAALLFNNYIADICFLDKSSAMPLLIKLAHFDKLDYHGHDNEALKYIELILFKLTFNNASYRVNDFVSIAKLYQSTNYESFLLERLKSCAQCGFRPWWDFTGATLRYFTENTYHYNSSLKYILYRYENQKRRENRQAPLNIEECKQIFERKSVEDTLDHITPQTPNWTEYPKDFINSYLNNLGNLSLLTWGNNSAKSNHNPAREDVRAIYNNPYYTQKEIYDTLCERNCWTEREIEERKHKLLNFIIQEWKLQ